MSINSKAKGKAGELEWVKVCKANGYDSVRRTAQYCGKTGNAADCVGLPGIHQEVKRVERLNLYDALEQAIRDSEGTGNIPVVFYRKNNAPWVAIQLVESWFPMYREWEAGRGESNEDG